MDPLPSGSAIMGGVTDSLLLGMGSQGGWGDCSFSFGFVCSTHLLFVYNGIYFLCCGGVMSGPNSIPYGNNIVNLTSWNVRGLNNPVRRARVFSHLRDLHSDIMFLQETHIRHTDARETEMQLDRTNLSVNFLS